MAARTLEIVIAGDARGAVRAFTATDKAAAKTERGLTGKLSSMQAGFKKWGAVAGLAFAGTGALAVKFGLDMVSAAEESQKATAQTAAVIKSTGAVANVTAVQVDKLAQSLSAKSGIDDELIQSGENVLLTFTRVRNEVGRGNDIFNQATRLALDMSVALGQDMQSSVIQLGKALNDPIRGLTSLRRVGVAFTQQQQDQIKALVAAGDTLGAQKIILQELATEFGGSAEAQATASAKLAVAWENLKEELGAKLLPVVARFSDWAMQTGIPALEKFADWVKRNQVVLAALAGAVLGVVVPAFVAWAAATIAATWPLLAIGAAVGVLAFLVVKHFDTIKKAFTTAFDWLKRNWPMLVAIIAGPIGVALLAVVRHWDKIKGAFLAGVNFVIGLWRTAWTTVRNIVVTMLNSITQVITSWKDRIVRFFAGAASWLLQAGQNIIRGLWQGILLIASQMFGYLGRIGRRIRDLFVNAGKWLFNAGRDVIGGLFRGMKDKAKDAGNFLKTVKDSVISGFKSVFGIGSPAKVMIPIGRHIMEGLITGLSSNKNFLMSTLDLLMGATTGRAGKGVERWRSTALAALAYTGQSARWINDLLMQMAHESGGNPTAINLWDINAQQGHPSQGLMQTIPSTFYAYAGELANRGILDPFANIVAAIRYTVARYGTLGAWAARGFKGYATGGVVPGTGPQLATVHGGEGIFTPTQMRHLSINGRGGPTTVVNVTVHGSVMSEKDLVATINRQLSRGAINKNGRAL